MATRPVNNASDGNAQAPIGIPPRRRLRPRWPIWIVLLALILIAGPIVARELRATWLTVLAVLDVQEQDRFAGLALLAVCLIIALLCIKALRTPNGEPK